MEKRHLIFYYKSKCAFKIHVLAIQTDIKNIREFEIKNDTKQAHFDFFPSSLENNKKNKANQILQEKQGYLSISYI